MDWKSALTRLTSIIQWKPFPAVVTAVFALGLGTAMQWQHSGELKQYRDAASSAAQVAKDAIDYADSVEVAAAAKVAEAQEKASYRATQAPARAKVVAAAPAPCKPAIDALTQERDEAVSEAQSWKDAYESEKAATGRLHAATVPLVDATETLVKKSGTPFLKRILPQVGIGGALGVDPEHPEQGIKKVVGVTLSWHV